MTPGQYFIRAAEEFRLQLEMMDDLDMSEPEKREAANQFYKLTFEMSKHSPARLGWVRPSSSNDKYEAPHGDHDATAKMK